MLAIMDIFKLLQLVDAWGILEISKVYFVSERITFFVLLESMYEPSCKF